MTVAALAAVAGAFLAALVGGLATRRARTLRVRLALLAAVAAVVPVAALLASGIVMLDRHEELALAGIALAACAGTLVGAALVARSVLRPLDALGEVAVRLGGGDLAARAAPDGPAELREVARAFNRMAADVESLFDARRELVAWASHDLRTPIAAINAMIEAVEDGVAPVERYLPRIQEQVGVLSRTVDDLLELSVIDAGAVRLDRERVPVAALLRQAAASVEAAAAARGVRVAVEGPAEPLLADCAPDKVERVLANLLGNALRHAPDGGAVRLTARAVGEAVEVAVEDDGPGFPPDGLARAFEPFWRADGARGQGGAGLGLAIAWGLVEAHGGRIRAENASPGARVAFTLPRAPAPARAELAAPV